MSENKWSTQLKKLGGNNKIKLEKTEGRKLAKIKQEDNQLTNNKTTEWINISYQKKGKGERKSPVTLLDMWKRRKRKIGIENKEIITGKRK